MNWKEHVVTDHAVLGGKPVIKGTRVPVQVVIGSLAAGMTVEEVGKEYRVTVEQIRACLAYAAEVLAEEKAC